MIHPVTSVNSQTHEFKQGYLIAETGPLWYP